MAAAVAASLACRGPLAELTSLQCSERGPARGSTSAPGSSKLSILHVTSLPTQLKRDVRGVVVHSRKRTIYGVLRVTAQTQTSVIPEGRASPVSTPEVEALLDSMKWDSSGLVVAIAQHAGTGAILMQGFANRDAISATLASRRATFYTRSRKCLWTKGETSNNFINVVDMYLDCDRDSVIYMGLPDGPTCHTGAETCFFTRIEDEMAGSAQSSEALTTFYSLEATIAQRRAEAAADAQGEVPAGKPSWTRRLLDNPTLLCSKIREEAGELCQTLEAAEGRERAASEMADLLYHSLVLMAVQDVKLEDVADVLRARFATSGVEEKASRKPKN